MILKINPLTSSVSINSDPISSVISLNNFIGRYCTQVYGLTDKEVELLLRLLLNEVIKKSPQYYQLVKQLIKKGVLDKDLVVNKNIVNLYNYILVNGISSVQIVYAFDIDYGTGSDIRD